MLFNSYISTCLDLNLGENTSIAMIPSQNSYKQLKSPNPPRSRDPTRKSKGEKGLRNEFYSRFQRKSYREVRVRNSPQLRKREANPMRDEEGDDGDLAYDRDLQEWPQRGRKILLLEVMGERERERERERNYRNLEMVGFFL